MKVIPYSRQSIDESDIEEVANTLRSDFVTQGPCISMFEKNICHKTGAKHAVLVSNGTAALHLSCLALGMNENTIGITSPISFAASANCILYCKSKVLFADIDPQTGIIDPQSIKNLLKNETSQSSGVIIPVSLNGQTAPLEEIQPLANKYDFKIIEDAAHSFGSWRQTKTTRYNSASCEFSDTAILSFHPAKHICSGEGGAITTNNKELANKLQLLRSHGIHRPPNKNREHPEWFYEQTDLGFNYRITDIQAALGNSQLSKLDTFIDNRIQYANRYRDAFSVEPFTSSFTMLPSTPGHSYHLFVIHFKNEKTRDQAHSDLKKLGISTQVHYLPIYKHPYYKNITNTHSLPGAEEYFNGCLSIPLFPKMTLEEHNKVIESLREICNNL